MDDIEGTSVGMIEPRHFWRRAFAYLIDVILAWFVISILFYAVFQATGYDLGLSGMASKTTCEAAPPSHPQVTRIEGMWPLAAGEVRQNFICRITTLSKPNMDLFLTQAVKQDGAVTYTRKVNYPIDASGMPVNFVGTPDFSLPLYVVIFAFYATNGRRSAGKSLMSLRIRKGVDDNLGWGDALRREGLKFLPLLAMFAFGIVAWFSPPAVLADSETMIIAVRDGTLFAGWGLYVAIAFGVASFLWWFGPFLFWRGRTWYDMLAGTWVIRVIKIK